MVVYEAARAIVNLRNVTPRELQPAVSGNVANEVYDILSLSLSLSVVSSSNVFEFS